MPFSRSSFLALAMVSCVSSCALPASSRSTLENQDIAVSFLVGGRSIDHSDFESASVYGVELDWKQKDERLSYEFGATVGDDSVREGGVIRDVDFYEGYFGARWHFPDYSERLTPYVSAGANYLKADRTTTNGNLISSAEDWGGGVYVRAGAYGPIGSFAFEGGTKVLAGGDLRVVFGDDYDWIQFTLTLGFTK